MTKKMRSLLLLLVFTLLATVVYAEEQSAYVNLILRDASTNLDINNVYVAIDFGNNQIINQFVRENSILVRIDEGRYNSDFMVEDLLTKGRDYYGKDTIIIDGNLTRIVYVYPVGTLRGLVKDKLDNLVGNAQLKFECSGPTGIVYPTMTDKFGAFVVEYIPVSHCRIFASFKEGVGLIDIRIEKGSLNDIEIKLNTSLISVEDERNYLGVIVVSILAVIFVVMILLIPRFTRKKGKKDKHINSELERGILVTNNGSVSLGQRAKDVLGTLKDKEKEVVEFIINEAGKTTQSRIYFGTGIPKVSLHRYIRLLEQKKIIEVKKIGKVNQIQLTKWFLMD